MKSHPIMVGADIELSNFIAGRDGRSDDIASRLVHAHLLEEGEEEPLEERLGRLRGYNINDIGRKWLASGACVYLDCDHLEICPPMTQGAWEQVHALHALLSRVRKAVEEAQKVVPDGQTLVVSTDACDRLGNSWGPHCNFYICRECFQGILEDKPYLLSLVASHLASSVCFTGSGKLGRELDTPPAGFQKAQRPDHFVCLKSATTMSPGRGIVNTRDESFSPADMARLHVIYFDAAISPRAALLRLGTTQLLLAMIHEGLVPLRVLLRDPVRDGQIFSRDVASERAVLTAGGERLTDVNLQRILCDAARAFVDEGRAEDVVPEAARIVRLWDETLTLLERRDYDRLDLDWVLRLRFLERYRETHGLGWDSAELRAQDVLFAAMTETGPLWTMLEDGILDRYLDRNRIEHLKEYPTGESRDYFRGMMLRYARPFVRDVDWDHLSLRVPGRLPWSGRDVTLQLRDPLGNTFRHSGHHFATPEEAEKFVRMLKDLCS